MLLCLYSGNYHQGLREVMQQGLKTGELADWTPESNYYLMHSKMYALSDKYDMYGLRVISSKTFSECVMGIDALISALDHVYSSTGPAATDLRKISAGIIQRRYAPIMSMSNLRESLKEEFHKHGELGWFFFSKLFNRNQLYCFDCDTILDENEGLPGDNISSGICRCNMTELCGSNVCGEAMRSMFPRCWSCGNKRAVRRRDKSELPQ